MATVAVLLKLDEQHITSALQEAGEKLSNAESEVIFDFSSIHQLYPNTIQVMEELARKAEEKSVKVVLRDVNVHVYKVLKLVKLASRFSFANTIPKRAND